jgi:hypothetical protein
MVYVDQNPDGPKEEDAKRDETKGLRETWQQVVKVVRCIGSGRSS